MADLEPPLRPWLHGRLMHTTPSVHLTFVPPTRQQPRAQCQRTTAEYNTPNSHMLGYEQRVDRRPPDIVDTARDELRGTCLARWLQFLISLHLVVDYIQASMASQDFWYRFGLNKEDKNECLRALRDEYVGYRVKEFEEQGYCSYTLLIAPLSDADHDTDYSTNIYSGWKERSGWYRGRGMGIVQLRPTPHALDLDITHVASKTYPSLVPTIDLLDMPLPAGLKAYTMNRLAGISLSRLLPRTSILTADEQTRLETLILSFANFIAQSWHCTSKAQVQILPRTMRADSPMDTDLEMLSQCRGKVGSSILHRLKQLAADLPDASLRTKATEILSVMQRMTDYPVVLNHGDLIPSNILIDRHSWEVTGVVDWAEAEFLPFGTCLYGLEHLLGYLAPASSNKGPTWAYFKAAARLRDVFWKHLWAALPELKAREEEVRAMRDLGVLLWHGIAWDAGAIDRVVCESRDEEELAKLRAFLGVR